MRNKSIFILLAGLFFSLVSSGLFAMEGTPVSEIKTLKLHPGQKGNPFSIIIPLDLEYTGQIRLSMSLNSKGKKGKLYSKKGAFRFLLLNPAYEQNHSSNTIPKKYILKEKYFFNPSTASLNYFVDDPELKRLGGKYTLMISNLTNMTCSGEYRLRYPGSREESRKSQEKPQGNYPDLVVSDIFLNNQNKIILSVMNKGRKGVPEKAWSKKGEGACNLDLTINNKFWGGASIQIFDPEKKLLKVNGKVLYVTNYEVRGKTRVQATIDSLSRIRERSENNNSLVKVVLPGQKRAEPSGGKFDLAISDISLSNRSKIVVTITNVGKTRVQDKVWDSKGEKAFTLNLAVDKKSWGGATLKGIDPNKRLRNPGASVAYTSNYTVTKETRVSARIDALSNFPENNERNNRMVKMLKP